MPDFPKYEVVKYMAQNNISPGVSPGVSAGLWAVIRTKRERIAYTDTECGAHDLARLLERGDLADHT